MFDDDEFCRAQMTFILGPSDSIMIKPGRTSATLVDAIDKPSRWRRGGDWIRKAAHCTINKKHNPTSSDLPFRQPPRLAFSHAPSTSKVPGTYATAASFLSLPTELHLEIALYLSLHALEILRSYPHNATLRQIYAAAKPMHIQPPLKALEKKVLYELQHRDAFESRWRALESMGLDAYTHMDMDTDTDTPFTPPTQARIFFCITCMQHESLHHFSPHSIRQSMHYTGLSKIAYRKCRAAHPVALWPGTAMTFSQTPDRYLGDTTSFSDLVPTAFPSSRPPRRLRLFAPQTHTQIAHPLNTLTLTDLSSLSWLAPRGRTGVDAVAAYEVPLFALWPGETISVQRLAQALRGNGLVMCPHVEVARWEALVHVRDAAAEAEAGAEAGAGDGEAEFRSKRIRGWGDGESFLSFFTREFSRVGTWGVREVEVDVEVEDAAGNEELGVSWRRENYEKQYTRAQAVRCGVKGCGTVAVFLRVRQGTTKGNVLARRRGGWALRDEVVVRVRRRWRVDEGPRGVEWRAQVGCP